MSGYLGLPPQAAAFAVLEILSDEGWDVAIVAHQQGVEVSARRGDLRVSGNGPSVVDVALLMLEAGRRSSRPCGI